MVTAKGSDQKHIHKHTKTPKLQPHQGSNQPLVRWSETSEIHAGPVRILSSRQEDQLLLSNDV